MAGLLLNQCPMGAASRTDRGFSLVELMLVVALLGTLSAVALPVLTNMTASIKLNDAARTVERELQNGRLSSVSSNRLLRLRTNCPGTGYIRLVEVLGTAADTASDRCLATKYPFPAADNDVITRPNFDGPVRTLPLGATVTTSVIEFRPDGTATNVVSGVAEAITTPVVLTVTRSGKSKLVTINGLGKVQLQ